MLWLLRFAVVKIGFPGRGILNQKTMGAQPSQFHSCSEAAVGDMNGPECYFFGLGFKTTPLVKDVEKVGDVYIIRYRGGISNCTVKGIQLPVPIAKTLKV